MHSLQTPPATPSSSPSLISNPHPALLSPTIAAAYFSLRDSSPPPSPPVSTLVLPSAPSDLQCGLPPLLPSTLSAIPSPSRSLVHHLRFCGKLTAVSGYTRILFARAFAHFLNVERVQGRCAAVLVIVRSEKAAKIWMDELEKHVSEEIGVVRVGGPKGNWDAVERRLRGLIKPGVFLGTDRGLGDEEMRKLRACLRGNPNGVEWGVCLSESVKKGAVNGERSPLRMVVDKQVAKGVVVLCAEDAGGVGRKEVEVFVKRNGVDSEGKVWWEEEAILKNLEKEDEQMKGEWEDGGQMVDAMEPNSERGKRKEVAAKRRTVLADGEFDRTDITMDDEAGGGFDNLPSDHYRGDEEVGRKEDVRVGDVSDVQIHVKERRAGKIASRGLGRDENPGDKYRSRLFLDKTIFGGGEVASLLKEDELNDEKGVEKDVLIHGRDDGRKAPQRTKNGEEMDQDGRGSRNDAPLKKDVCGNAHMPKINADANSVPCEDEGIPKARGSRLFLDKSIYEAAKASPPRTRRNRLIGAQKGSDMSPMVSAEMASILVRSASKSVKTRNVGKPRYEKLGAGEDKVQGPRRDDVRCQMGHPSVYSSLQEELTRLDLESDDDGRQNGQPVPTTARDAVKSRRTRSQMRQGSKQKSRDGNTLKDEVVSDSEWAAPSDDDAPRVVERRGQNLKDAGKFRRTRLPMRRGNGNSRIDNNMREELESSGDDCSMQSDDDKQLCRQIPRKTVMSRMPGTRVHHRYRDNNCDMNTVKEEEESSDKERGKEEASKKFSLFDDTFKGQRALDNGVGKRLALRDRMPERKGHPKQRSTAKVHNSASSGRRAGVAPSLSTPKRSRLPSYFSEEITGRKPLGARQERTGPSRRTASSLVSRHVPSRPIEQYYLRTKSRPVVTAPLHDEIASSHESSEEWHTPDSKPRQSQRLSKVTRSVYNDSDSDDCFLTPPSTVRKFSADWRKKNILNDHRLRTRYTSNPPRQVKLNRQIVPERHGSILDQMQMSTLYKHTSKEGNKNAISPHHAIRKIRRRRKSWSYGEELGVARNGLKVRRSNSLKAQKSRLISDEEDEELKACRRVVHKERKLIGAREMQRDASFQLKTQLAVVRKSAQEETTHPMVRASQLRLGRERSRRRENLETEMERRAEGRSPGLKPRYVTRRKIVLTDTVVEKGRNKRMVDKLTRNMGDAETRQNERETICLDDTFSGEANEVNGDFTADKQLEKGSIRMKSGAKQHRSMIQTGENGHGPLMETQLSTYDLRTSRNKPGKFCSTKTAKVSTTGNGRRGVGVEKRKGQSLDLDEKHKDWDRVKKRKFNILVESAERHEREGRTEKALSLYLGCVDLYGEDDPIEEMNESLFGRIMAISSEIGCKKERECGGRIGKRRGRGTSSVGNKGRGKLCSVREVIEISDSD